MPEQSKAVSDIPALEVRQDSNRIRRDEIVRSAKRCRRCSGLNVLCLFEARVPKSEVMNTSTESPAFQGEVPCPNHTTLASKNKQNSSSLKYNEDISLLI
jgi:hypothetical protein